MVSPASFISNKHAAGIGLCVFSTIVVFSSAEVGVYAAQG